MPEVVPPEDIGPAMKLAGLAQDGGVIVGNLLGAALLVLGPQLALAANAGTFLLSALLLAGLPALRPEIATKSADAASRTLSLIREGGRVLFRDKDIRYAAVLANVALGSATAIESLAIPYSAIEFPDAKWLAGAILATIAGLSVVATVLVRTDGGPAALLRRTALLTAIPAVIAAPLLLASMAALPVIGFVILGLLFVAITPANTLISPRLPAAVRASAFSVLMGGLAAVQATLTLLAGFLADLTTPHTAAAALCLVPVAAGVWVLALPEARRSARDDSSPARDAQTSFG
jgi:hypothetical protein